MGNGSEGVAYEEGIHRRIIVMALHCGTVHWSSPRVNYFEFFEEKRLWNHFFFIISRVIKFCLPNSKF